MYIYNKYEGLKCKLKESIAEVIEKLGQGLCDPVPYDTAWVARVPQIDNISLPAFPLSLQWLRDHQLDNGSWGSVKPFSPHSSTLNTLAAIIALAQWNNPEDKTRIEHGVKALWRLVGHLPSEVHEGVGFELILPTLQNEARKYGLDIPHEYYTIYEQKSKKKLNLILDEFRKYGFSKPATWWHNLEILGDNIQSNIDGDGLRFSFSMLTENGSIGLSPSATAFMLRSQRLKGADVPEAQKYLQHLYSLYKGGISDCFPIDILELSFSVDFFIKSSLNTKHPLLQSAVSRLAKSWNPQYGVGYSANWKLFDADDTSVALSILLKAGYNLSPEPVLRFFNGTNIAAFVNETTPSVSVNINAINALKLFKEVKEVDEVIQKVLIWLDTRLCKEQVFMDDKWNISPYYSTSRAVFALHGLRDEIVKRCLDFFIKSQNRDGGWGKDGFSTAEETAYVALALTYGLKCDYAIPETMLEAASNFLYNSDKLNNSPLWIDKVLYCPTLVAESAVFSAQYALAKTLKLTKVKSLLNEIQPHIIEANMKNIDSKKNYHLSLLCLAPEFDITRHYDQITRVRERIINRLIELKLIKTGEIIKKTRVPECNLYHLRSDVSDEDLIIHGYLTVAVFIYADILDNKWQQFKDTNVIEEAFRIYIEILQGKRGNIDTIIPIDFPAFIPQCELFLDIRHMLAKKQSGIDEFLFILAKTFSGNVNTVKYAINGLSLSSDEYLELKKVTSTVYVFHYLNFVLNDVVLFSFKDYTVFHEFEDCAIKAGCLAFDMFSFSRDNDRGCREDNYILVKQDESNCSLEDALNYTVKLYNKQVIKMYSLKKTMQDDPTYKSNQELFKAVGIIENSVQSVIDWASEVSRYQYKTTVSFSRKKLIEARLPLILQFFDNNVSDTTPQNLGFTDFTETKAASKPSF